MSETWVESMFTAGWGTAILPPLLVVVMGRRESGGSAIQKASSRLKQ
jgi:hypothetical protein